MQFFRNIELTRALAEQVLAKLGHQLPTIYIYFTSNSISSRSGSSRSRGRQRK